MRDFLFRTYVFLCLPSYGILPSQSFRLKQIYFQQVWSIMSLIIKEVKIELFQPSHDGVCWGSSCRLGLVLFICQPMWKNICKWCWNLKSARSHTYRKRKWGFESSSPSLSARFLPSIMTMLTTDDQICTFNFFPCSMLPLADKFFYTAGKTSKRL